MTSGAFRLLDAVDRTRNGPPCKARDFDLKLLPSRIQDLQKEYGIKYDPDRPVNDDNSLADALYQAGLRLFLDVGVLCVDTDRRITFTEDEVKQALRDQPGRVLVGQGKDAREMYCRKIEDSTRPVIFGGPVGGLVSPGRPFLDAITSMAKEPIISMVQYGSISSIEGRPIIIGSPLEIHAARCESRWMREAAARAGRPGMHLMGSSAQSAAAEIANSDPIMGYRPTDGRNTCLLSSLKIDYNQLNKVKHFLDYSTFICAYHNDLIGGYTRGADGSAIACVASAIANVMVNCATYHCIGAPHIRYVSTTNRMSIWADHLVSQALSRNTHLISFASLISSAGPCTEMLLYETAVFGLLAVSGANLMGTMGYGSKRPDRCTGLEEKFLGEIGYAATGLRRDEANEITNKILPRYENKFENPPPGKTFQQCYDSEKLIPTSEWQGLYESAKHEIRNLGIPVE